MIYYLDTNSVRQINKLESFKNHKIFTSALSIFEIISGINCEDEYFKRKNILNSINKSNLIILWELPRLVLTKAFNLPFIDTDSEAIKIMMKKILDSESYQDLLIVRFNLGAEDYLLDTFIKHDQDVNETVKNSLNISIKELKKEERKKIRSIDIDIEQSDIRVLKEIQIRNFLMNQLSIKRVDENYFKCINYYIEHNDLDDYFTLITLLLYNVIKEGLTAGANDGMDYQHLTYTFKIDFFVSDDKFFKRIPNNITEHLAFKFIDFSSFKSHLLENNI